MVQNAEAALVLVYKVRVMLFYKRIKVKRNKRLKPKRSAIISARDDWYFKMKNPDKERLNVIGLEFMDRGVYSQRGHPAIKVLWIINSNVIQALSRVTRL